MLALHFSFGPFSFGALGTVIILGLVVLIVIAPLFNWVPDLIYWLVQRRKRRDESSEHSPPPLPPRHSSHHDENA
jgi:hypothetical protein